MAEIVLTTDNFEEEVLKAEVPVLVDFYAVWCGPCKMIAPIVKEVAEEYEGVAKVGKLNVDDYAEIAIQYGITAVPTLLLFYKGEVVDKTTGYCAKVELTDMIDAFK